MNNIFNTTEKIGDIVSKFPKAVNIFKEYNIDFCCGGNRSLSIAIDEQNLNKDEIIQKLNASYLEFEAALKERIDWRNSSLTELIQYIVDNHHTYLIRELPILKDFISTILDVHGIHHREVLTRVDTLFNNLKIELEQHLIKEEEDLFPLIMEYDKNPNVKTLDKAWKVINELESEHEGAGAVLKELRKITDQYTAPPDGCNTYRVTFQKLEELESDLFQHIHLENNILFPRLQSLRQNNYKNSVN
jgi:regulator of cell morphogenesis and NO signaling